ncbi:MAG TPA: non-canonical purine NTP pyrophosphatase [Candidatus Saccharimonadales bacterium]
MQTITLVTGNKGKLAEWQRLFPASYRLQAVDLDLDEIQSLDLTAIATDKVKRAYASLGTPVMVEDVSAGLDNLGVLPGPFIKFFIKQLGQDALFQLAGREGEPATATCTIAFYDGKMLLTATGQTKGTVTSTRGENGFGCDKNFMPNGQAKTYAEMTPAEKDTVSHRSKAVTELVRQLQSHDI